MDGVKELLDLVSEYVSAEGGQSAENPAGKPFGARVFKISRDENNNRLTHMKIVSGTLKVRDQIGKDKVDQIRLYSGDKYTAVKEAEAGMICAVTGLTDTRAGEGLGTLEGETISEVLQPILSSTLVLPEEADAIQVYGKLKALEEE